MKNTMEDPLKPEPDYALVFGCILALGLPLNAVSLWIFLRRHSLKSPNAVFMVNLAISDLLLVTSLPMRVYFYATGTWPLGVIACVVAMLLFRNNIRSSAIFITFICVDRLLAVVYPVRSRHLRTSSNAWKAAVLVWLFVSVLTIARSVDFSKYLKNHNESVCFETDRFTHQEDHPRIPMMPVLVFIMLAVNVVCTILVSWTLHSRPTDSAGVSNKLNIMLIFIMNLVMFTICFLPLSISLLLKASARKPLACLAAANCCLDPLFYYFSLDAFWKKKEDVDLTREE